MEYTDIFKDVDNLIVDIHSQIKKLSPTLQANLAGFFAVRAITVYELAIKYIIENYAASKDRDFGEYITNVYSHLNGRIGIDNLKRDLKKFGECYKSKFEKKLKQKEDIFIKKTGDNISFCYSNLLMCRHCYVHEGKITLTINESINDYKMGKHVIAVLYETMK